MTYKRVLVIFVTSIAFATFLAGYSDASSVTPTPAAVPSDNPALTLVQRFNMGAGLETLANQVARTTTTFGVIAKKHGASEASKLVKAEISKALPTYQSRWNQNLALIYSKHFSAAELQSLATLGTSSPYAEKFKSTHAVVGAEMHVSSSHLLKELVTEALIAVAKQ